jgi:hypothetical protein
VSEEEFAAMPCGVERTAVSGRADDEGVLVAIDAVDTLIDAGKDLRLGAYRQR